MTRWSTEHFYSSDTDLYVIVKVKTCHYMFVKTIECAIPRVTPNVNYGLRVIMMWQYRFITCNHWVGGADMDIRGGCIRCGEGSVWESSIPTTQFCRKSKTALKIIYF